MPKRSANHPANGRELEHERLESALHTDLIVQSKKTCDVVFTWTMGLQGRTAAGHGPSDGEGGLLSLSLKFVTSPGTGQIQRRSHQ
jgi:hypothetical protein